MNNLDISEWCKKRGISPGTMISRQQARQVPCPECGAMAGNYCMGRRGVRMSNHIDRVYDALRLFIFSSRTH